MKETAVKLGKNVKFQRIKKGLSQEDLAAFIKVDKAYVSRVENGKKNLTLKSLIRISQALNIDLAVLFK